MLIIKHTVETTASPAVIWNIWKDVARWNSWDHSIEYSAIDGPFTAGTKGVLKPKGGPRVNTLLTEVAPLKMFRDESKLFFARIIVSHFLTESQGKTKITHQVEMKGPLAFVFAFLIGRSMKKNLPTNMQQLVKKAESAA